MSPFSGQQNKHIDEEFTIFPGGTDHHILQGVTSYIWMEEFQVQMLHLKKKTTTKKRPKI